MSHILTVLLVFSVNSSFAKVPRVSKFIYENSQVAKLHVKTGLVVSLNFPCEVIELVAGNNKFLQVKYSDHSKRTIFLTYVKDNPIPTNFIAKCERQSFVFDLIPGQYHQDYIEIVSSVGSVSTVVPKRFRSKRVGIKMPKRKFVIKKPKLIRKSGG